MRSSLELFLLGENEYRFARNRFKAGSFLRDNLVQKRNTNKNYKFDNKNKWCNNDNVDFDNKKRYNESEKKKERRKHVYRDS